MTYIYIYFFFMFVIYLRGGATFGKGSHLAFIKFPEVFFYVMLSMYVSMFCTFTILVC